MTVPVIPRQQGLASILGSSQRPMPGRSLATMLGIPEKREIFVSYHHKGDQWYYDTLAKMCDDCEFLVDRSVHRILDSDNAEYQERRIREEFIQGTSTTIVLCGAETGKRKFVDWEIHATLWKQSALIGIYLPSANRNAAGQILVPDRLHENIQSGYAIFRDWNLLTAANLRIWIEATVKKDKSLIRNGREKMTRNA
jgi:hypothetical protein